MDDVPAALDAAPARNRIWRCGNRCARASDRVQRQATVRPIEEKRNVTSGFLAVVLVADGSMRLPAPKTQGDAHG